LEKESISELTWQILLALSENYVERGNFKKAKHYVVYTGELLQFISDNVNTSVLRKAYLMQPERKLALQKLEKYYNS
jgi:hypothetical protein